MPLYFHVLASQEVPETPPNHTTSGAARGEPTCYFWMPTCVSSHAYSNAWSFMRSYRPDAPPCPAGSILIFNSSGLSLVFNVRSRATYFAGSQYITWLSLKLVVTRIAGYARFSRLSYGLYVFM